MTAFAVTLVLNGFVQSRSVVLSRLFFWTQINTGRQVVTWLIVFKSNIVILYKLHEPSNV